MEKKDQFLMEVQTGVIIRGLKSEENGATSMYLSISKMNDAYFAADRIPAELTAHEAACNFLEFVYEDTKDGNPPSWCLRS
ncbi:hypothetical protein KAR91_45150 [Candidatus Pacearchaeota archaeon]|nr:hypothetical protein [Candidatus Pacearchaeota archaeon]